jgi:S1-C subfamily serine protease
MQVVGVRPGSSADRVRLRQGDVVLRLNSITLKSAEALREALLAARSSRSVLLVIRRGPYAYHLTLPF